MNETENQPKGRKVSLEDLLQMKRAERPPAEFWVRFDQELRAKQLAAIVHKRTWWQSIPRLSRRALWLQLPAGAAAAAVLSLMVVRESRLVGSAERESKDAFVPAVGSLTNQSNAAVAVATAAQPAPVAVAAVDPVIQSPAAEPTSTGIAAANQTENSSEQSLYSSRRLIAMHELQLKRTEPGIFAGLGFQSLSLPDSRTELSSEVAAIDEPVAETGSSPASKLIAKATWSAFNGPTGPAGEYRKTPDLNQRFSSTRLEVLSGGIQVGL